MKKLVVLLIVLGLACKKKHPEPDQPVGTGSNTGSGGAIWTSAEDPDQKALATASDETVAMLGSNGSLVGQVIDATATAHRAVPRDAWDPSSVITAVGKDRAALFAWVRDHTALVPYRGSLRGPVGVMMDRVGNSLDRSLLLAELLKQAGLEVRLANAQLDPALLAKLVAGYRASARPPVPTATLDETALIGSVAKLLGIDQAGLATKLAKEQAAMIAIVTRTKARVAQQVQALSALVPASASPPTETDAFVDHWWVQVHDGELWSDLDPSGSAPGEAVAASATDTLAPTDLADDRRHTLSVRVIGEVWHDDVREEATLLDHTFAPNQFYGQRIVVQTVPLDMPEHKALVSAGVPAANLEKALLAQTEFAPILRIGGSMVAGSSVNERGELVNLTAGDGNTIRLGRAVQHATKDGVGGATDLLGELPGSDTPAGSATPRTTKQAFTAEWLEIEVHAPGSPSRVVRRTIFDTLGAVADRAGAPRAPLSNTAKLDRAFAMIGETELLPLFAQIPPAFVEDRMVKALVDARQVIVALATHQDLEPLLGKFATLAPIPGPLYGLAASRFSLDPQIYLDRLNVLALHDRLVAKGNTATVRRDVDILANGVAVWPSAKDPRAARIAQGVADTALEGVTIGCAGGVVCARSPNTSELYSAANGKGWSIVAAPGGVAAGDHDAGYTIIAAGTTPSSWWRIDPSTGETLGMNPFGGDESADYLTALGMDVNLALGVNALAHCIYLAATTTDAGAHAMVSGVRCVGAAALAFGGGQYALVMLGARGLLIGALLNGIAVWVG